jgi:hypothetical protein
MYTTAFQLRAKNSAGTVLYTFKEIAGIGRHVSLSRGQKVSIEREGILFDDQSYFMGSKQVVAVDFMAEGIVTPCETGGTYVTLQAVLNGLPAGGTLEYSLDGGTNWVPCVADDIEPEKPGEVNVGNKYALVLTSRAIVANPFRTS